jgi:DNA-binding transcriptional MerR regulator
MADKRGRQRAPGPTPTAHPWKSGEPTLTVGEIAERLSPIAPDTAATIQRIRHWTREQMLVPIDQHHEGTGKHRRYAENTVYDAAILHAVTSAGLHVATQRYLIDALSFASRQLPQWKESMRLGHKPRLFLTISKTGEARPELKIASKVDEPTGDLTIIIDLGKLFARVSQP